MQSNPNDVSFTLFGFPTTIQPFFWLLAALVMGVSLGEINDMPMWITQMLLGMAAIMISILIHELGHAFTFRHLFHVPSNIILHGFGGVTVPWQSHHRSYGIRGTMAECFLSFSGPLAGFVCAFLFIGLNYIIPANIGGLAAELVHFFLWWTAAISIIWGIFNLLPVYPMDGGHISREIFLFFFPRRGIEFSLIVSMMLAALLGILALRVGNFFMTFLFGFFAYQNYQELSFRSFRR